MYAVLGALAALENVVPPLPSDAAVALGAFLSHRGVTTPFGVFLVVWLANFLGAVAVYFASRRYGRRLFATRAGRRLLAPEAIAAIEREYLRFGIAGIFLSRFLPGIRAVVPPFAGLTNLGPARTLVPLGLASALWYGGLTALGSTIGSEWSHISALVAKVNRGLVIVATVVVVGAVVWLLARWRQRRRERLWNVLYQAFGGDVADPSAVDEHQRMSAAALLLLELAYTDDALTSEDRRTVAERIRHRWGLESPAGVAQAADAPAERSRFATYRQRVMDRFGQEERVALVERLWQVALQDGAGAGEQRLVHLAGTLLGISADEVADAERRVAS